MNLQQLEYILAVEANGNFNNGQFAEGIAGDGVRVEIS